MNITGITKRDPLPDQQKRPQASASSGGGSATRRRLWKWILVSTLALVAIGIGVMYWTYAQELQAIRQHLSAGSQIVQTRHGPMEYRVEGDGAPVLVVHGAGGGYDQGMLLARAYSGAGFRWIVPSRFGYLGTPLPAAPSTQAQAEAFADLIDTLGIKRVGIVAMSGGVPPSLQFARLYPERTSALVLLSSAPYTPLTADDQELPVPIWLYQALFKSDFPFWLLQKITPQILDTMFDVTPTLRAELSPDEEVVVANLAESFQPVTWRIDGLNNEGAAIDPQADYHLEEINIPTLVVHAEDDQINPISIGKYTAENIHEAHFLLLPSGGHLLLGHHAEIRGMANDFLHQHATGARE